MVTSGNMAIGDMVPMGIMSCARISADDDDATDICVCLCV